MNFLPVNERITQDIVDTLKTIRKVNGYANDVTVERIKKGGNAPLAGQSLAVVRQGSPIRVPEESIGQDWWEQPYFIDCYINPAEDLTEPPDKAMNIFRADVEKALTYQEASLNRGGLAQETIIKSPGYFVMPSSGRFVVQVNIAVRFATEKNNPYKSPYSNVNP